MKNFLDRLRNTGLTTHGATVAFTPARAVTSHLRKRYRTHYISRFQFPRVVFAFDLTILLCTIFLIALQVALFVALPPRPAPLGLMFTSGPVQSAAPVTLVASVSSRDGRARDALTLEWQLPENTEILNADPAIASDKTVYLGRLEPGQTIVSRLVVRFYVPIGDMNIGFRVHDIDEYLTGEAKRRIQTSALKLEPLFADSSPLQNGKIPFRVQNSSDLPLDGVMILNAEPSSLGTLAPKLDRIVFAEPGARVSALVRAVPLVESFQGYKPVLSKAILKLLPSSGSKARLEINSPKSGVVHVYHPALAHPHIKDFTVTGGVTSITVDLDRTASAGEAWYAAFQDGTEWSQTETSQISTPFEISSSARYFASTGDQIGIGPLPPRVGEETKYWVQLKLSPTQSDMSNVVVKATLGADAVFTGREGLPSGGTLSQEGGVVTWTIPYLPADENGSEARFEISITPSIDDRGKPMTIISKVTAEGVEVKSNTTLNSSSGYVDTFLFGDEKAAGRGIVE